MRRLDSFWLVSFFALSCCGERQPSSVPVGPGLSHDEVSIEPESERGQPSSVFRIVDPVVTEISFHDMRTISYRPPDEVLEHTSETKELETALMNWLSERPFERKCITFDDRDIALEAYAGETIGVIGSDKVVLPKTTVGRWIRTTEEELENRAKQECQAFPYLKLSSDSSRLVYEGRDYVSGGCFNELTQNGLIDQFYPEGHRFFLAHRAPDGRVHITRSTRGYNSRYSLEDRRKQRVENINQVCETHP